MPIGNDLLVVIMYLRRVIVFVFLAVAYGWPSVGYAQSSASLAKCNAPLAQLIGPSGLDLTDLTQGDPFYYTSNLEPRPSTTHSDIPHLPVYSGYMSTNNTYRFVNVVEQVFTLIGEGKHGLWRIQENGMVREYRRAGKQGLPVNADVFDKALLQQITNDYSHDLPEESWAGYKLPANQVDEVGLTYIDLPIHHAKYAEKYEQAPMIDLPHWYCTLSNFRYPYAKKAVDFAFAQEGANRIGPLGVRAGLNVRENFPNVLRLSLFSDARSWVNVGTANTVDWQAVDGDSMGAEYYLYERLFFNEKYLFVAVIYEDVAGQTMPYVRPYGAYYEHLQARGLIPVSTRVTIEPEFYLQDGHRTKSTGTHLYGVHHPNRASYQGGGACPLRGGDYADYPKTSGGAGWPTNYEEVTPLCDAVLVDIKFTANLDGSKWDEPEKYLANAGTGQLERSYAINPYGEYGRFSDLYHTQNGIINPQRRVVGPKEILVYKTVQKPVSYLVVED